MSDTQGPLALTGRSSSLPDGVHPEGRMWVAVAGGLLVAAGPDRGLVQAVYEAFADPGGET